MRIKPSSMEERETETETDRQTDGQTEKEKKRIKGKKFDKLMKVRYREGENQRVRRDGERGANGLVQIKKRIFFLFFSLHRVIRSKIKIKIYFFVK